MGRKRLGAASPVFHRSLARAARPRAAKFWGTMSDFLRKKREEETMRTFKDKKQCEAASSRFLRSLRAPACAARRGASSCGNLRKKVRSI